jgi:hypothetical protein
LVVARRFVPVLATHRSVLRTGTALREKLQKPPQKGRCKRSLQKNRSRRTAAKGTLQNDRSRRTL